VNFGLSQKKGRSSLTLFQKERDKLVNEFEDFGEEVVFLNLPRR